MNDISQKNEYKDMVKSLFENLILPQQKHRDNLALSDILILYILIFFKSDFF